METKDSAIDWIEVCLKMIVHDTGGTIGNTEAHRRATHIFEHLAHQYAEQVAEEADEQISLTEHLTYPMELK